MSEKGSEVAPVELVGRFLYSRQKDVRPDNTIRPERLYPFRHVELSVSVLGTRSVAEIWDAGDKVGAAMANPVGPCIGRADLLAKGFYDQSLSVVRTKSDHDPGHADVRGWPPEKEAQKQIALEIIRLAAPVFVER